MVLCFCAVNSVFTQLCMLGTVLFIVYMLGTEYVNMMGAVYKF